MNIFEALEKGGGRATLPGVCASRFIIKRLIWVGEIAGFKHGWDGISDEDLKRNDWMPYVPSEERKIEGMVGFKDPWGVYHRTVNEWRKMGYRDDYIEKFVIKPNVPRETCSNCGQAFPSPKLKHREVFNVTRIHHDQVGTSFPEIEMKNMWSNKKNTKVIIEWEE